MADYRSIIEAVKKAAAKNALEDYELYLSSSESIGCETFRDQISEFSSSKGVSVYFRCVKNGKLGYATTQKTDEDEISLLVARAAENALINEKDERAIIYDGSGDYREIPKFEFTLPSAAKLADIAMELRNALYDSDKNIADGSAGGTGAYLGSTFIFNSKGLTLESESGNASAYMYAVVSDDNGGAPECAFRSEYDLDNIDKKALAEYVINKAKSKFGAGNVKTGKYNIIISRECMAEILSTYKSVFYADSAQKGFSKLGKKFMGTKIASDKVTLIDTPFKEDNPLKSAFDGEGYPTREKYVIKDGILETMLYNLTTAEKDGTVSTGNASRGSSGIGTRVFSFYILPGDKNDDELMKLACNGIFVTGMKGFHAGANTISGDFSIESEGFIIEDGKLSRPVRSFTVAGNFFELLKNIKEVSSELEMRSPGFTQIASPAVLIENMSVAGE